MSKWYDIRALAADGSEADPDQPAERVRIDILDEIGGWGISAKAFIEEFRALPDDLPIEMTIHSPGGNVFEALAIYHVLASARERLTAHVVGIAASAATLPLMAAGKRIAPANAYIMVHNPVMYSFGDAEEMRDTAAFLDRMNGSLASIYAANTGAMHADLLKMMDDETWLDGPAALEAGFIHEVTDALPVAASLPDAARARFTKVPQALLQNPLPQALLPKKPVPEPVATLPAPAPKSAPDPAPDPMPADEIAQVCLEAGETALAPLMIRAGLDAQSVARRLIEARAIRALAAAAGRADDAQALIVAGASVAHARSQLLAARAADVPAIRPQSRERVEQAAQSGLDERLSVNNIYARRKVAAPASTPAPV